ncbi:CPBP family intramembrane glutamic endopeptidase [Myroides odoratimimus]|uniref:CPBP family intramembrane glutamic endopeptidase n=1 Tax=Myroides odoratimimus TaxID=76832 RepID=UPI002DBD9E4B|nr:CPBP family intramembrane glutamic endopeptidase [Myroides odoratimimus]MEC4053721.1 CPBP family intramembrane glutamic endopeptidase [Myroides odoratimimus]
MKNILLEVYRFIKNPNDQRIENWTLKKNIEYLLAILLFELFINALIYFPLIYFLNKVEPLLYDIRIDYNSNTFLQTLVITAILFPIAEEFIFRYTLRYNKLFSKIINRDKWNFVFKILVYTSILLFGFVHSSNFENNSTFFYCILPILVSTQLFGGVFLTFLRVRFNLLTSIISHILWNGLLTIIPIIISIFEKPYERTTNDYAFKIEYLSYNTTNQQKFQIDSANNKIFKIEIEEYSINHILDSLYQYKRNRDDILINIKFESKTGLTKEELKNLLLDYDKSELQ